jgi:hypothetical protein
MAFITNQQEGASMASFPGGATATYIPSEGLPFYAQVLEPGAKVIGAMPSPLLEQVTYDPRYIEKREYEQFDHRLEQVRPMREAVQRLFEGVKRRNVSPYSAYISRVAHGERDGTTPAIELWTPEGLKTIEVGYGMVIVVIPFGALLIPIDGETQLAARYASWEKDPLIKQENVPVILHFGRSPDWARQAFHDLNTYGSKPNAAVAISMDNYDPATTIARRIETEVPFLDGFVNKVRRQLRKSDRAAGDVVTISGLRASIVTIAKGISGVAAGSKSIDIPEEDMERVHQVARAWWTALGDHLSDQIRSADSVASAPAALAALGAVGHRFLEARVSGAELEAAVDELAKQLATEVRWEKGEPWSGIAGKFTATGRFSVGGAKETSYLIYHALTDPSQPGYEPIRRK